MIAVLLATGETNKLRPLTEVVPSPMVPIVDRPIMEYVVELLARHGIKRIIVSLHHHAHNIEAYFGNGQRWGVSFEYVLQRDPLGTAGALKWAKPLLTETFLVLPADALVDVDVDALLAQHSMRQSEATIVVHPSKGDGRQLLLDENNRIVAFAEPMCEGDQVTDTGAYVLEPSILDFVPERVPYDLSQQLIPALLESNVLLHGFALQGYWNPLCSFEDHQLLQQVCLSSAQQGSTAQNSDATVRYPSIGGRQIASGIWVGSNNVIHPSVQLAAPVYIGENCRVGRDVDLGPDAVIGTNVIVDDGATIQQSTVMERTYVGQYVHIKDRFVNKNLVVDVNTEEYVKITDDFLLGEVQVNLAGNRLHQGFDSLLAFILFVLTLPLTLLIALILRLGNGRALDQVPRIHSRPDIHRHDHESEIGTFNLLRFHTRNADGTYTSYGRILERWELHRLPELWNVVKGEIMLVGVKPLEPDAVTEITEPWQQKRFEYSAGFTGLWYTQAVPGSSLDETLVSDAYYVATRTWRTDLRIFFLTPISWFKHRAGYQEYQLSTTLET